jgi:monothiol glutaredoxin
MANARERIEKLISENPVVLFMKGTPEFPQCGFSGQVIQILEYVGAPVVGVNVLEDPDIRQGVKEYANWPTVPSSTSRASSWAGAILCVRCSSPVNWRRF